MPTEVSADGEAGDPVGFRVLHSEDANSLELAQSARRGQHEVWIVKRIGHS